MHVSIGLGREVQFNWTRAFLAPIVLAQLLLAFPFTSKSPELEENYSMTLQRRNKIKSKTIYKVIMAEFLAISEAIG